jgi:transcriptional regulator with XRE-family HTH domain
MNEHIGREEIEAWRLRLRVSAEQLAEVTGWSRRAVEQRLCSGDLSEPMRRSLVTALRELEADPSRIRTMSEPHMMRHARRRAAVRASLAEASR